MEISLQMRRYRLLFILSGRLADSFSALFNFIKGKIGRLLEICNQQEGTRRDPRFLRGGR